jgi:hypothetical protein
VLQKKGTDQSKTKTSYDPCGKWGQVNSTWYKFRQSGHGLRGAGQGHG